MLLPCLLAGAAQAASLTVSVADASGRPLAGAVVAVEIGGAARTAAAGTRAEVVQRQRNFEPGVLVVQTGTQVDFPNQDTVRHHVYSFSPAKKFELKLYAGTPAQPVRFEQSGVVVLGCNIHDQMVGWVLVLDTPYYAQTSASGQAALSTVPAGRYRLRTWHARLPAGAPVPEQALEVSASGATALVRLAELAP